MKESSWTAPLRKVMKSQKNGAGAENVRTTFVRIRLDNKTFIVAYHFMPDKGLFLFLFLW